MLQSPRTTRRRFLKATAAGLSLAPGICRRVLGANERLNIASVGANGRAASDINACRSENIVALCDVDHNYAGATFAKFPKAARFKDYRVMLDKHGKHFDSLIVAAPDHSHALPSAIAMQLGKHVYCEKPLTHSVFEARTLRRVAAKAKVVTQMGNNGHSNKHQRRIVELVQAGVIGQVREVHVWTDRPIWPQGSGVKRPTGTPPVPKTLDWDLWLGPAPHRPYHHAYHPFNWRGWWDFGTGALGDIACHTMDIPFWALHLDAPTSIEPDSAPFNDETYPAWSIIRYNFPQRKVGDRVLPAVKLTWYDGGKMPPGKLVNGQKLRSNGYIIVGQKDTIFVSDRKQMRFLSGATVDDFKQAPVTFGRAETHQGEWVAACKGQGRTLSHFDYAGRLTESVLLGNVALRFGQKIEWDAGRFKVTNVAKANDYLRREYRRGWDLERAVS